MEKLFFSINKTLTFGYKSQQPAFCMGRTTQPNLGHVADMRLASSLNLLWCNFKLTSSPLQHFLMITCDIMM